MSCAAIAWSMDVRGLGAPAKWVLVALAQQCDEDGPPGRCRPSLARLAEITELGRSTVKRALAQLEHAGLLRRSRGGGDCSTVYALALDRVHSGPGVGPERTGPGADPVQPGPGAGPQRASPPVHSGLSPRSRAGHLPARRGPPAVSDQPLADLGTPPATRAPARLHHNVSCSEEERAEKEDFVLTPRSEVDPDVDAREAISARPEKLPAVASKRTRQAPKAAMPPDWTPSERVYVWAEARGLTRADVLDELDEFRIYWADAGTARASWDATFINRLKQIRTRRTDPTPTRAPSTSEDVPHATQPELRFRNTIERFHWIEAELCRERAQADHERDLRGIVHEYDRQHGGFQPVGATLGRLFSGA